MMTLIEELRLAVLELWQTLGLERSSRTAAAVVPALVVGIVLNVIALNIACGLHLRITGAKDGGIGVTRADVNAVKAVLASTVDKSRRGLCLAQQWIEQKTENNGQGIHSQADCNRFGQGGAKGV